MNSLFVWEWRKAWREREVRWALSLAVLLNVTALSAGQDWLRTVQGMQGKILKDEAKRFEKMRATFGRIEQGLEVPPTGEDPGKPDPRNPADFALGGGARKAWLPLGPLAALSAGQGDLLDPLMTISLRNRLALSDTHSYTAEEIENPVHLALGRFDVAFVAIFLYPLFILGMAYHLLASEAEAGTLPLLRSQPLTLGRFLAVKALARWALFNTAVLGSLILGFYLAGIPLGAPGVGPGLAWVALSLALYSGFWVAVCAAVNSRRSGSAANALAVALVWLGWVVLAPLGLRLVQDGLEPAPDRVDVVLKGREVANQIAAAGNGEAQYYLEHPQLLKGKQVPDLKQFGNKGYAVQQMIERELQPVLQEQADRGARRQRSEALLVLMSPATALQCALNTIAGTDQGRFEAMVEQALVVRERMRQVMHPKVFAQTPITTADLDAFPPFKFAELSRQRSLKSLASVCLSLALLTCLACLAGGGAERRWRSDPVAKL